MRRKNEKGFGSRAFDIINIIILTLFLATILYPLVYVLAVSLSDKIYVLKNEVLLIPKGVNFDAYEKIFEQSLFAKSYLNTIIYAALSTAACILITILTAYPLSKKKLKGGSFLMMAIAFTMLFSGGLIPYYLLIKNMHMIDTVWVMFIPGAFSSYYIIITRTFFQGLPAGLEEAASIDGCSDLTILTKIVVPLSKPIVATISLFTIVGVWNNYFGPLIFLNTQEKFPLQLVLRSILITSEFGQVGKVEVGREAVVSISLKYASIIVAILPMLLFYPFVQKYFVKGMMVGSLKG